MSAERQTSLLEKPAVLHTGDKDPARYVNEAQTPARDSGMPPSTRWIANPTYCDTEEAEADGPRDVAADYKRVHGVRSLHKGMKVWFWDLGKTAGKSGSDNSAMKGNREATNEEYDEPNIDLNYLKSESYLSDGSEVPVIFFDDVSFRSEKSPVVSPAETYRNQTYTSLRTNSGNTGTLPTDVEHVEEAETEGHTSYGKAENAEKNERIEG